MATFSKQDLEHIINGAGFLSSGGGGAIQSGRNVLSSITSDVHYISTQEAIADAEKTGKQAAVAAYIGAPDSVLTIHRPQGALNAITVLDNMLHQPEKHQELLHRAASGLKQIQYILPVEIGPLSSLVACAVAADLGLPVVDVDGVGRAVPSLPMLNYAYVPGLAPSPAVLATEGEEAVSLHVPTPEDVEDFARPIISLNEYQSKAGLAMWAMPAAVMRPAFAVKDTLSLCKCLGQQLANSKQPVRAACDYLLKQGFASADIVFTGKIIGVDSDLGEGFDDGRVRIQVQHGNSEMLIYFKNENIIAWQSGQPTPTVTGPDLISYVTDAGQSFTNADIQFDPATGKASILGVVDPLVHVLAISPNPHLLAAPSFTPIKQAFEQLLVSMGYPVNYLPHSKRG